MIRHSFSSPPEAWETITVVHEGEEGEMRVRYRLLPSTDLAEWQVLHMRLMKAARMNDTEAFYDSLMDELSSDRLQKVRNLLIECITDWDLLDADTGDKRQVNPESIAQVLNIASFWKPLFKGLLDASGGEGKKKPASSG